MIWAVFAVHLFILTYIYSIAYGAVKRMREIVKSVSVGAVRSIVVESVSGACAYARECIPSRFVSNFI